MKNIQQLVDAGYKQAAFKYKANAEKFMAAWRKKGYYVEQIRSSGPVGDVQGNPYTRNAYYCMAEKEKPKLSSKEQRLLNEYNRRIKMRINEPKKYYTTLILPSLRRYIKDVDPEIRKVVLELNNNNQFTIASCAGHGTRRGEIFFDGRNLDGWKIREIMKKHGLTGITKEQGYRDGDGIPTVIYEFDPIGR